MIKVCEIFASIQGESTYAGMPCVFIRLGGCNLRCNYCDTTYAAIRRPLHPGIDYIAKLSQELADNPPLLHK